jgi:hypothetical protein
LRSTLSIAANRSREGAAPLLYPKVSSARSARLNQLIILVPLQGFERCAAHTSQIMCQPFAQQHGSAIMSIAATMNSKAAYEGAGNKHFAVLLLSAVACLANLLLIALSTPLADAVAMLGQY